MAVSLLVKSRSWYDVIKFYQNVDMPMMLKLVEQIASSPYAHGIYATTSMHTLWISQNPEFEIDKDMLRVEFYNDKFVFSYKESPYSNKVWKKECDGKSGFSTFKHIMNRLKWFLN